MQEHRQHEQFGLEVLKLLSDAGLLGSLIFGGGTCLRLCFGLNRYSVDLDFWQKGKLGLRFERSLRDSLARHYTIIDFKKKHFSLVVELKSPHYTRSLKIEIRKKEYLPKTKIETELNIAFSPVSSIQVRLTTFTLKQMWRNKVAAFLGRKEIRDAYDLEFIYKKGEADLEHVSAAEAEKIGVLLKQFRPQDFKVELGSLLEAGERGYYSKNGFKLLELALRGLRH